MAREIFVGTRQDDRKLTGKLMSFVSFYDHPADDRRVTTSYIYSIKNVSRWHSYQRGRAGACARGRARFWRVRAHATRSRAHTLEKPQFLRLRFFTVFRFTLN